MRASERSAFYGLLLEPPRATPSVLSAAKARCAETTTERDDREARRTTRPAPKGRRRGPRGVVSREIELVADGISET